MRKYKAVVFDLDGTLLDTIDDLTNGVNHILKNAGYPIYSSKEIMGFVGHGIRNLMSSAVPGGEDNELFEEIYNSFREYYTDHCRECTRPYEGIEELLKALKSEGVKLAIVSNKNYQAVEELKKVFFDEYIDTAVGQGENTRKKPAPDTLLLALSKLGVTSEEAIYIGDSDVDKLTADNANMDCILVSWGFRDRKLLESMKPLRLVDRAEQILDCVL